LALIDVAGLHKHYSSGETEVKALDGVDLSLEKGDFSVLSGRSGSGKTTLLNMVGTLDTPDAGKLSIAGEDVLALSRGEGSGLLSALLILALSFRHII